MQINFFGSLLMILKNLLMISPMIHDTPKESKTCFVIRFSIENTKTEVMRVKVCLSRKVMFSKMKGLENIPDLFLNKNDSLTEK